MKSAAGMGMWKSYLTLGARMMLSSLVTRLPWLSQLPPYSSLSSAAVGPVCSTFIRQFATLSCHFPRKLYSLYPEITFLVYGIFQLNVFLGQKVVSILEKWSIFNSSM